MDAALLQALLQDDSAQSGQLKRQQALAQQLQGMAFQQPQGQMVSGYYVAPSPLAHLVPLASAFGAKRIGGQADQTAKSIDTRRTDARMKYMDALQMGLRKNYPQPSGPVLPPSGMEDR